MPDMKNKKNIVAAVVVIVLIIAAVFSVKYINRSDEKGLVKTITINVFDKENINIFNENIDTDKKYLIDVLDETEELKVVTEDSQYGKFITSILDIEQGDGFYWSYYIDGKYAETGVSSCETEDGKVYDFKIEALSYQEAE